MLAARKRFPNWRIGSPQFWLRGHVWLGLLSVFFILFHSGFGWGGLLEQLLWVSFGLVTASGLFGLVLQHVLPRMLTRSVPLESFVEQIPYLCKRFQAESDLLISEACGKLDVEYESLRAVAYDVAKTAGKLRKAKRRDDFAAKYLCSVYSTAPEPKTKNPVAKRSGGAAGAAEKPTAGKPKHPISGSRQQPRGPHPRAEELKSFYLEDVRPFLSWNGDRGGRLGEHAAAGRIFAGMRARLPEELHPPLADLEGCCEQRRQFTLQSRIHHWLHYWLMLHIPVSIALLVLVVAHVIVALRVVPFGS